MSHYANSKTFCRYILISVDINAMKQSQQLENGKLIFLVTILYYIPVDSKFQYKLFAKMSINQ
jgi:hypothetical protein